MLIREENSRPPGAARSEEIKAPKDGIVVYATSVGSRWRRRNPMAEGRQVRFNESIIFMPNIEQMVANLAVAEAYEPLVRVGQTVRVTVDARPGEVFTGTIDKTTPLTESGGWLNPGQREFTARVRLDAPSAGLKLSDALHRRGLPRPGRRRPGRAGAGRVHRGRGALLLHPAGRGRVQRRAVEIGRASETLVESGFGPVAGDRVLVTRPAARRTPRRRLTASLDWPHAACTPRPPRPTIWHANRHHLLLAEPRKPIDRDGRVAAGPLAEAGPRSIGSICVTTPCRLCDGRVGLRRPRGPGLVREDLSRRRGILALPIYNYDGNAAAKNLIELTGKGVWLNKTVGFLCSAGGSSFMSIMGLATA